MKHYNACDAHKRYSLFGGVDEMGRRLKTVRVEHERIEYRSHLKTIKPGSTIALETMGSWYWMVDEIEKAGHIPLLVHARKAKLMMGMINKTDAIDVGGLGVLSRNNTLPTVWIPPQEIRDLRELPRTRMNMVNIRTGLKNRIHATFDKYNIRIDEVTDIFGKSGRQIMAERLNELPPETRRAVEDQLKLLDDTREQIAEEEARILKLVKATPEMLLLKTLPGFGPILSVVAALEIGSVERFPGASHLASYAGTVARVSSSGGVTRMGGIRPDVNRFLRWAFIEAANCVVLNLRRNPSAHVSLLYKRIRERRGHGKAIVAVSRHLAEASYWVLTKKEPYRAPGSAVGHVLSNQG